MAKTIVACNDPSVHFLVDDEDYADLNQFKWYSMDGYASATKAKIGFMHRYLMSKSFDIKGLYVDHENLNPSDNRKANLRVCTQSQNQANMMPHCDSLTGFKGVRQDKWRWAAQIGYNGATHHIGNFDTPEEAAVAYDIRAQEYYGCFARLNFPDIDAELRQHVLDQLKSAKKTKGRSKYRGVSFYSRWKARVNINRRAVHLGYFDSEEDAARAVDAAVIRLGLSSPLNFPVS